MKLDPFKRYQVGLTVEDLFPNKKNGLCGCGCDTLLSKNQRRWASKACLHKVLQLFWIVKGDSPKIRKALWNRDFGVCCVCGESKPWDADHIVPVHKGGGACDLDNFQTICDDCHSLKNKAESIARSSPKLQACF